METPQGIVAVYVHEGRVIAHVADFLPDRYGGYTKRESQEHRVNDAIGVAVVKACGSYLLGEHIDRYTAGLVLQRLPGKVVVIPIGYEDSEDA